MSGGWTINVVTVLLIGVRDVRKSKKGALEGESPEVFFLSALNSK